MLESVGLSLATQSARAPRSDWCGGARGCAGAACGSRRDASTTIDAEVLLRLDTCWAAATGLGLVDMISASDFVAQHLHMALDAGEPSRIARGAGARVGGAQRRLDVSDEAPTLLARPIARPGRQRRHAAGDRDGAARRQHRRDAPPANGGGRWPRPSRR